MSMALFDTHCHLGDEKFEGQHAKILEQAQNAGVNELTVICADPGNIKNFDTFIPKLRSLNDSIVIHRTAGLHPHEADHYSPELEEILVKQLEADAIAVGETGLDYHYDFSDRAQQRKVFAQHIDWSCQFQKPLVIHCREAAEDVLELLDRQELKTHPRPGILHCFTENLDTARRLLDMNFYISFSGILTFKNAGDLREVAQFVPLNRLLIETDSPYLAPIPHRGKANQPAYVKHVYELICTLRPESPEEIREQLWKNSHEVFAV